MSHTYLTTQELSELIKYNPRTIRNELKDTVLKVFITFALSAAVRFYMFGKRLKKICVLASPVASTLWHYNKEKYHG